MKYLNKSDLSIILRSSKAIEQLLEPRFEGEFIIVRYVHIVRENSEQYSATIFEVVDEGSPEFLDVYEFSPVDPDFPYGKTSVFSDEGDAVRFACKSLDCDERKFLGFGMIQDEYRMRIHPEWK